MTIHHQFNCIDGLLLICLLIVFCWLMSGCNSPLIQVNRQGSILPDVNVLNGSLNGNEANGNDIKVPAL
jgi:hypothetical protein